MRRSCVKNAVILLVVLSCAIGCQATPKGWKAANAANVLEAQAALKLWIARHDGQAQALTMKALASEGAISYMKSSESLSKPDRLIYASRSIMKARMLHENCPLVIDARYSEAESVLALIRQGLADWP